MGLRIWERTPVSRLRPLAGEAEAVTPGGAVRARRAVLTANAYSGALFPRLRTRFVPFYDYVLVSEPLSQVQRERMGWAGREGAAEHGNPSTTSA